MDECAFMPEAAWSLNRQNSERGIETAISKFGTRIARDTDDSAPTGDNSLYYYLADNLASEPTLSVTHEASAGGAVVATLLMTGVG